MTTADTMRSVLPALIRQRVERDNDMTRILPQHYYSASDSTGEVSASRFGANSDEEATIKILKMFSGTLPTGVKLWRHRDGNPVSYIPVPVTDKNK